MLIMNVSFRIANYCIISAMISCMVWLVVTVRSDGTNEICIDVCDLICTLEFLKCV